MLPPHLRTLRGRLQALALLGSVLVCATGATGLQGLRDVAASEHRADVHEDALLLVERIEVARERLRGDLALHQQRREDPVLREAATASGAAFGRLAEEEAEGLTPALARLLDVPHQQAAPLLGRLAEAVDDRSLPLPAATEVAALQQPYAEAAAAIEEQADEAEAEAIAARSTAEHWLTAIGLVAVALLGLLTTLVSRAAVRSLRWVAGVAAAVSGGELTARTGLVGGDEVAQVGRSLDEMADTLQALLQAQRSEAEQQEFGNRLGAALEHADTPAAVLEVAARAMAVTGPGRPMELLLADSSRAHVQEAAVSEHGRPGCRVATPHGCPAVRSGGAVVVESSADLDACPRLREREEVGSAVCVPVTFMGRALGVLHSTQPEPGVPPRELVRGMRTLAALTGSRLGTVQALATAELQASTDLLTGLSNRRTAEERLRELQAAGTPYGVALLDLDRFKSINDTYGHEAGDRALRVFASVLPVGLREHDTAARWGGEEFLLVLPEATVQQVRETVERVQAELAVTLARHACPLFTVSAGVADSLSHGLLEEQLAMADAALLTAKRQGRDRVVLAGTAPLPAATGLVPAQVPPADVLAG